MLREILETIRTGTTTVKPTTITFEEAEVSSEDAYARLEELLNFMEQN